MFKFIKRGFKKLIFKNGIPRDKDNGTSDGVSKSDKDKEEQDNARTDKSKQLLSNTTNKLRKSINTVNLNKNGK